MGRSRSAATCGLVFVGLFGCSAGQMPPIVANLAHYKTFIRAPDPADTNFTAEARMQRKMTVPLTACSDMNSYTKITNVGLFSLVSPKNALAPPNPNFTETLPGAVVGGSLYNMCFYGIQDHAMGFPANPPVPHGVMLTCKGEGDNYAMEIQKYFGNCEKLSVPYATYTIFEEDQDALLRGECVSLGDSGFIQLNMTVMAGAIMAPLLNCSAAHTEKLTFSLMSLPVMPFFAWTSATSETDGGQVLRHNMDMTARPKSEEYVPWNWDMVRAYYTQVLGSEFDKELSKWPKHWFPTKENWPMSQTYVGGDVQV